MLVGLALLACAAAPSPLLTIHAVDAADGQPLAGVAYGLVRPGGDAAYARFEGPVYDGPARPRAGDRLYAYRRGYDTKILTLPDAPGKLTVRLRACAKPCLLQLAGDGAAQAESVIQVLVRAVGEWRNGPVRDSYEVRARGSRIRLAVSNGTDTRVLVRARPGLAWPALLDVVPGRSFTLHYDAPRPLSVRRETNLHLDVASVEVFADRLWRPGGPPERIDAWRWRLNGPDWLRPSIAGAAPSIAVAPDVPFHLFASASGRGIYRRVPRAATELDLRRPWRTRTVALRPVVDGRPVRAGAWIAPGRLDLFAVASLAQLSATLKGCVVQTAPLAAPWTPVSLPAAAWLTVWHAETGLAHVRWTDDTPPSGKTAVGRIVLRVPAACRASGYVSVFPVWKGTGAVVVVPPDKLLRHPITTRDRAITLRGLPPGRYGLDVRVRLTAATGVRTWRVGRTLEVDVTAAQPLRCLLPRR